MTIDDAVREAYKRIAAGEHDELATWVLDNFALPIARLNARDPIPDVGGWGLDVVEIGEAMTGSWTADDALAIATVIVMRAEDARDEHVRAVASGDDA